MSPRVIVLQALTVPRSRFDQGPDAVRNHMGPETFNVRQAGNGETEQCVLIEYHGKEYISDCYVLIINRKTNQVLQMVEAICLKISLKISTLLLLSNTSIQILSFLKQMPTILPPSRTRSCLSEHRSSLSRPNIVHSIQQQHKAVQS